MNRKSHRHLWWRVASFRALTVLVIAALALTALTACESAGNAPDELSRMTDAQQRATEAARDLQRAALAATSRADATREALILSAQATRLMDQAHATQTTFAQNAQATQTVRAFESTRSAQNAQATATAQSAQATATTVSANQTATTFAQNVSASATTQSLQSAATATTQAQQAIATATTHAQNSLATSVSASATATSNAANAQAARVAASATETVTAAGVQTQVERENWARITEWVWAIGKIIGTIAGVILVCLAAYRAIEVWVFRRRIVRGATGTAMIVRNVGNGFQVIVPERSPGPVINVTPPENEPWQVETPGADPDTTKRAQAVELMLAATAGGDGAGAEAVEEIIASPRLRIVEQPPERLVSPEVRGLLEAQWKEVSQDDHASTDTNA